MGNMSYEALGFKSGQILTAEQMNHLEQGISAMATVYLEDATTTEIVSHLRNHNKVQVTYPDVTPYALTYIFDPPYESTVNGSDFEMIGMVTQVGKPSVERGRYTAKGGDNVETTLEYSSEESLGTPLVVNFDETGVEIDGILLLTADKTLAEVIAALERGERVIGHIWQQWMFPVFGSDSNEDVCFYSDLGDSLRQLRVCGIFWSDTHCYFWAETLSSFAGAGAEADEDGYTGLVPAPTKDDLGKFLSADGTWKEVTIDATGDLADLTTTDKTNLVSAINEVNGKTEEWIKLTEVTTEEEVQTMSLLWKETPCKKVMVKVITGAVDQAAGYMPTNVATTHSVYANDNPWVFGVGRFYPTPLPQAYHRNVTYVIEMVDMPDDVTYMHFTESWDNAADPTTILPLRAVNDAWTRGNHGLVDWGRQYFTRSDGIEGVQFNSSSYFPVGSVFEVWGIKYENL